jgi:16S rRNA (adenine1518-N6/adenine1519-N6)-dimethyltransferase
MSNSKSSVVNDEPVNIVNREGKVLGTTTKNEAHKKGILHPCVLGQVKNSQGKWLFVKQSASRQDPGKFCHPIGGHVQADESYEEALLREGKEELNLDQFNFQHVGKTHYHREVIGRNENHFFAIFEVITDEIPKLNHESAEYHYFTDDEIKKIVTETPEKFSPISLQVFKLFYPYIYRS